MNSYEGEAINKLENSYHVLSYLSFETLYESYINTNTRRIR